MDRETQAMLTLPVGNPLALFALRPPSLSPALPEAFSNLFWPLYKTSQIVSIVEDPVSFANYSSVDTESLDTSPYPNNTSFHSAAPTFPLALSTYLPITKASKQKKKT